MRLSLVGAPKSFCPKQRAQAPSLKRDPSVRGMGAGTNRSLTMFLIVFNRISHVLVEDRSVAQESFSLRG